VPGSGLRVSNTRRMGEFLTTALHDGSVWLIVACVTVLVGVVVGLYTRSGSEISAHPYAKVGDGSAVGTDMPSEATGREEIEPVLWPRRSGRHIRRRRS
jgi:hypothetical protein